MATESARRAWAIVLEAAEKALDVEGLDHLDRAPLVRIRDDAARRAGTTVADGLGELGLPDTTRRALERAGFARTAEVRAASDAGTLSDANGIGAGRLREVQAALRRMKARGR